MQDCPLLGRKLQHDFYLRGSVSLFDQETGVSGGKAEQGRVSGDADRVIGSLCTVQRRVVVLSLNNNVDVFR